MWDRKLVNTMPKFNPNQYSLALHTTTPQLGISIGNYAGDSRSQLWDLDRDLSTHLHQYLIEFLQPQTWQDLSLIAVAKGPGSFTSTRIGVVTARTLAQQLNIPLFAISTLAAVAWSERANSSPETLMAIQMDASRGQLFAAIYQVAPGGSGLIEHLPDTVMTPEAWQQTLDNLATSYKQIHTPAKLGITADSLLKIAYLDWQQGKRPHWSEVLPFYGQHPVWVIPIF